MTLRSLPPDLITAMRSAGVALTLLAANGLALAHDGHGMEGSHWHATDVLGLLVERVAGMPLDRFFVERITGPLGRRILPGSCRRKSATAWPSSTRPRRARPSRTSPSCTRTIRR
ncbi:MAG: hypothetical protein EBR18_09710, partial [Betaproteobacteria bacterium]|nr:hypothetical protein [Betaproteobacteria bacterium]